MRIILATLLIAGTAWSQPASQQAGWYIGMEFGRAVPARMSLLWSHDDIPVACDHWLGSTLDLYDTKNCAPESRVKYVGPDFRLLPDVVPGLYAGYAHRLVRLELQYYHREHSGYAAQGLSSRAGSSALGYNTDEYYKWGDEEYGWSMERTSDVWAHHIFFNAYHDFSVEILGPISPYVGVGAGYAFTHIYHLGVWQRRLDREKLEEIGIMPELAESLAGTLSATSFSGDLYDGGFAYQYMVGVNWATSHNVQVGLAASIVDIPGELEDWDFYDRIRGHPATPAPEYETDETGRPDRQGLIDRPIRYGVEAYEWRATKISVTLKSYL